jgi:histidinol dehydrogenase
MKTVRITSDEAFAQAAHGIVERAAGADAESGLVEQLASTQTIVDAVRERGDAALADFTSRFDGTDLSPDQFEVNEQEVDEAVNSLDADLVTALERAHANIHDFHAKNLRESWEETADDGTVLGQRILPIDSAGVYVPGGTAFYPSSVLMNIVPARVAGVEEIVMISPPSYNGTLHPLVLAAANIAGATRIFRVGGAQSVAALAYGTDTMPAVSKITGPGNIYVTLAKRLVSSVCDIDKEAGPSEVVVAADADADPKRVAIELLCQAEHDELAVPLLVTTSEAQVDAVKQAMESLLPDLSRATIIRAALDGQGMAFVVRDIDEAAALTNVIAPEHLSVQVGDPRAFFDQIRNAGAVMLGSDTPVAVGDYYAGPNHILPTGRRARCASALGVEDFRKTTNYISYTKARIERDAADIMMLANAEELDAHARAVELRT